MASSFQDRNIMGEGWHRATMLRLQHQGGRTGEECQRGRSKGPGIDPKATALRHTQTQPQGCCTSPLKPIRLTLSTIEKIKNE